MNNRFGLAIVPLLVAALTITACGGGGSGGSGGGGNTNQAPMLSGLTLSQDTFDWQSGGGTADITATVTYSDPESDIVEIRIEGDDGTLVVIPVPAPLPSPNGQLQGQIQISTDESGVFTAEIWAVDSGGNTSNRLDAVITIVGGTRLTDLTISVAPFEPPFRIFFTGEYTAVVNLPTDMTTVTATIEDPNSTIEVNGVALASGDTTGPISLNTGINAIDVVVSSIDGTATDTYSISVLRNSLDLSQSTYIKASNTDFDDRFSESLALDLDTLVVTSRLEDSGASGVNGDQTDNNASNAGAAYVFTRGAGGTWAQQAYVKSSNAERNDFFGSSASIDGDTLAIGAVWESSAATGVNGDQSDNSSSDAGAAYVFTRDFNAAWSQQAYIKASNTGFDDQFGGAVALDGDTLVVGAAGEASIATGVNGDQTDNNAESAGAAYVFTRDIAGAWSQQAYLKASDTDESDNFGAVLALEGDTLVVGAPETVFFTGGDPSNETGGRIYVFTRDATGIWSQQARLQPATVQRFDRFGEAFALEGDMLAVGAPDGGADGYGIVYVFTRDPAGVWTEQAQFDAFNTDTFDRFGSALALVNGSLIIGAEGEGNASSTETYGAIYVFAPNASQQWEQQAYLRAENRGDNDSFGSTVAATADFIVAGANFEDSGATGINGDQADNSARESGAVYVFE